MDIKLTPKEHREAQEAYDRVQTKVNGEYQAEAWCRNCSWRSFGPIDEVSIEHKTHSSKNKAHTIFFVHGGPCPPEHQH